MAASNGMHSKRGLLRMLSPTQTASITPVFSACTAMSIRSFGFVPRVTSARLDIVRPNDVFFSDTAPSIGRGAVIFQGRYSLKRPRSMVQGSDAPVKVGKVL